MALSKSDWEKLDKRLDKREGNIIKAVVSQVDKTITTQTIRLLDQNAKLEQKYEDKSDQTKSEFFDKVDPVLKEVKTSQEERSLLRNRIEKLENIHPKGRHTFSVN